MATFEICMGFFEFFFSLGLRSSEFLFGVNYVHIVVFRIYDGSHFTDSLSELYQYSKLGHSKNALPTWLLGHRWTSLMKG